jgi:hypothetical protein
VIYWAHHFAFAHLGKKERKGSLDPSHSSMYQAFTGLQDQLRTALRIPRSARGAGQGAESVTASLHRSGSTSLRSALGSSQNSWLPLKSHFGPEFKAHHTTNRRLSLPNHTRASPKRRARSAMSGVHAQNMWSLMTREES